MGFPWICWLNCPVLEFFGEREKHDYPHQAKNPHCFLAINHHAYISMNRQKARHVLYDWNLDWRPALHLYQKAKHAYPEQVQPGNGHMHSMQYYQGLQGTVLP